MITFIQGSPSPLRPWCIYPLVSDFPLFQKKFSDSVENFPGFTFSEEKFRFSFAKISNDLFLVIDHTNLKFPPLFSFFHPNSTLFRPNLSYPPTLPNFSLWFRKISVFCTCFLWFLFPPYFYHDAFMHVLDAPAFILSISTPCKTAVVALNNLHLFNKRFVFWGCLSRNPPL